MAQDRTRIGTSCCALESRATRRRSGTVCVMGTLRGRNDCGVTCTSSLLIDFLRPGCYTDSFPVAKVGVCPTIGLTQGIRMTESLPGLCSRLGERCLRCAAASTCPACVRGTQSPRNHQHRRAVVFRTDSEIICMRLSSFQSHAVSSLRCSAKRLFILLRILRTSSGVRPMMLRRPVKQLIHGAGRLPLR